MTTRFSVQAAETSVKVVVIRVTTTGANHPVVSVTYNPREFDVAKVSHTLLSDANIGSTFSVIDDRRS